MNGIFDECLLPELMAYNEKILGDVFNEKDKLKVGLKANQNTI